MNGTRVAGEEVLVVAAGDEAGHEAGLEVVDQEAGLVATEESLVADPVIVGGLDLAPSRGVMISRDQDQRIAVMPVDLALGLLGLNLARISRVTGLGPEVNQIADQSREANLRTSKLSPAPALQN